MSNSADTARADAGSSERAGRTHANATCGVMMTAEVQEEEPIVTAEGGVRAPKLEPETGRRKCEAGVRAGRDEGELVILTPPLVGRMVLTMAREGVS